ncbi:MAG: hypothetical protein WD004_05590 [Actinomycetota bacterium]
MIPQAQILGGPVTFVGTRLRPLRGGARFRKEGSVRWNDGGIRVDGSHLMKSGIRAVVIVLGLFLGVIGVLLMVILTENAFLTSASLALGWDEVSRFAYFQKKGVISIDLGGRELSPVTFKGEAALALAEALRARHPDREVEVKGTTDIGLLVAALVMLAIIIGIVAFVLVRY